MVFVRIGWEDWESAVVSKEISGLSKDAINRNCVENDRMKKEKRYILFQISVLKLTDAKRCAKIILHFDAEELHYEKSICQN